MKILLVNPATRRYKKENGELSCKNATMPLGIAFIAAFIEKKGYQVKILDMTAEGYENEQELDKNNIRYGLSLKDLEEIIKDYNPNLVGVTCIQTMRFYEAQEVCRVIKSIDEKIVTVMGGSHVTATPQQCLKDKNLDFVVIGEGEKVFYNLLKAIESKGDFSTVKGLGYKEKSRIIINERGDWIEDLDSMPGPAWHLLPMEKYFNIGIGPSQKKLNRYAILVTSRGCPHKCYYCPSYKCWGSTYRTLAPEKVIEEICFLYNNYGIDNILFEEHNFITNKNRVLRICELIEKSGLRLRWSAPNGMEVNSLDYNYILQMARSGCEMLHLAIETTTKKMFDRMGKSVDYDHVRNVIKWGREFGLEIAALFMIGFPGETKKDIERTIEYAASLDIDYVHFFIATPLPGTDFFEEVVSKGNLSLPVDYSKLRYNIGNINTVEFTSKDVENFRREGWLKVMSKIKERKKTVGTNTDNILK
jgi:radical SAM superfamily enzyme YgiQ (UPF0313 family)